MDLRSYYQKIKDLRSSLDTRDIVIVSKPTVDGGLAGIVTEVPVDLGCRLIVEDKARLASIDEIESYRGSISGAEPGSVAKESKTTGKDSPKGR